MPPFAYKAMQYDGVHDAKVARREHRQERCARWKVGTQAIKWPSRRAGLYHKNRSIRTAEKKTPISRRQRPRCRQPADSSALSFGRGKGRFTPRMLEISRGSSQVCSRRRSVQSDLVILHASRRSRSPRPSGRRFTTRDRRHVAFEGDGAFARNISARFMWRCRAGETGGFSLSCRADADFQAREKELKSK